MQDLLNPEFFVARFRNPGGEWVSTNYSDTLPVQMDPNAEREFAERRVAYCTVPPGSAAWAHPAADDDATMRDAGGVRDGSTAKRGRDDVDMGDADDDVGKRYAGGAAGEEPAAAHEEASATATALEGLPPPTAPLPTAAPGDCMLFVRRDVAVDSTYMFPKLVCVTLPMLVCRLPPPSHAAFFQMYGDDTNGSEVKLTEVVEVIAVLSFLPELATLHLHTNDMLLDDGPSSTDTLAAHPPTSRVPRLHVLLLHTPRTADVPPLLPVQPVPIDLGVPGVAAAARQAALALLGGVLGGDTLAAEYLLLTLLSKCAAGCCIVPDGVRVCLICSLYTRMPPRVADVLYMRLHAPLFDATACPVNANTRVLLHVHLPRVHRRSQEGALGVFSLNLYQPAVACKPGHTPPGGQTASALANQLPTLLQALLPRCCTLRLDTGSVWRWAR